MLPLAKTRNARLILANRRDYAGAIHFTAQERADLFSAAAVAKTEPDAARTKILAWMRDRAREVYDLLVHIVREHSIPLAHPQANTGGILVAGWSFGTSLMTALLANMASFPVGDVDLRKYLRRVVFLGRPPAASCTSARFLSPMPEPDALPQGKDQLSDLPLFFSGYFKHGDINNPDTYEIRTPLAEPGPTWLRLTPEDIASFQDLVPGDLRGGMDNTLMTAGMAVGVFATLREVAVRLPEGTVQDTGPEARSWEAVEARHVWGDHSMAAMVWAMHEMRAEVEKGSSVGTRLRNVTFAQVEGGNHIMPWDLPERTLGAILRA